MALPKEPRQKMINIMYLVLTAILALNVSAEVINAFRTVNNSLVNSNQNIANSNATLYKSLEDKVNDPQTREKATFWNQKALVAQQYAASVYNYIEGLKLQVKQQSDLKMVDGKEDFKEDYLEASTRVFENNGKGKELYDSLQTFKNNMLGIDPSIATNFKNNFPIDMAIPPTHSGNETTGNTIKDWTNSYFHMTPAIAALTMLSKFQNNVKNAENQIVTYCHSQVGAVKFALNKFEPIAVANSTYLMPGEEITVTAGVGAFNDAAKPVISINGAPEALNANGVAEKKFNVSGGGNQKIHVHITYTDPNTGKAETLDKDIDYAVGTPGGAAVMLDKMNVFYIGVDNPVTIGSPTGWDKTTVSITGGTISGTGSKRIVRVTNIGNASINVTANGKSTPFPFRVKEIPNPVFKVGPGGTRMTAGAFKSQKFCRAELENFEFDTHFSVISAKVYFQNLTSGGGVQNGTINGSTLDNVSSLVQRCQPGSTITFDEVKVQGPDGKQRTIQGVGIVLY